MLLLRSEVLLFHKRKSTTTSVISISVLEIGACLDRWTFGKGRIKLCWTPIVSFLIDLSKLFDLRFLSLLGGASKLELVGLKWVQNLL